MANEAKRQQPANPELQTPAAEIFRQLSTAVAPAQDTKLQFNCPPGSQVAVGHFKASSTEQQ